MSDTSDETLPLRRTTSLPARHAAAACAKRHNFEPAAVTDGAMAALSAYPSPGTVADAARAPAQAFTGAPDFARAPRPSTPGLPPRTVERLDVSPTADFEHIRRHGLEPDGGDPE